jgi:hypothetical protein
VEVDWGWEVGREVMIETDTDTEFASDKLVGVVETVGGDVVVAEAVSVSVSVSPDELAILLEVLSSGKPSVLPEPSSIDASACPFPPADADAPLFPLPSAVATATAPPPPDASAVAPANANACTNEGGTVV